MTMQDELNTMSIEERGKIAVTMLASGMYLSRWKYQRFLYEQCLE